MKFNIIKLMLMLERYCSCCCLPSGKAFITEMHSRDNGALLEYWRAQYHVYICVNLSAACTVDLIATIARILPTQTPSKNLANSQFSFVYTHACQCVVISATGDLPYSTRRNNNCSSTGRHQRSCVG